MQLHFQATPWDLYACFAYTFALLPIFFGLGLGGLVAILLVFLLPGYVTVAAIYPVHGELGWGERFAFSLVLSLVVIPLLGLVLNVIGIGIRFVPAVLATTSYVTFVGILGYERRMRVPVERRLAGRLNLALPLGEEYSLLEKTITVTLAVSVVVAAGILAYIAAAPKPGERFTEFYILGPGGNASGYPTALNVSQNGSVIIGIANHEAATVNYTVRVDLVGVRIVYNATSGFNETVEVNRTTWSRFNVTLADGRNWTQPYTFRISYVGLWKIQFLLFKDGDFASAYRGLHLFVRVA